MAILSRARTSETDPLLIAQVPAGAGLVGLTICPGKRGNSVFGAGWERDLDADVRVIRESGAAARLLIEVAGVTPRQALDGVREARHGAVETPEQEAWALDLEMP